MNNLVTSKAYCETKVENGISYIRVVLYESWQHGNPIADAYKVGIYNPDNAILIGKLTFDAAMNIFQTVGTLGGIEPFENPEDLPKMKTKMDFFISDYGEGIGS